MSDDMPTTWYRVSVHQLCVGPPTVSRQWRNEIQLRRWFCIQWWFQLLRTLIFVALAGISILYHTLDYLCKLWQSLLLLKSHLIYYLIDGLLDLYHTTNTLCLQLLAETEGLCHSYYVNSVCPWRSSGCIIFFYNGSVVPFLISYVFSWLPNKTIITSSCQVNSVIIRLN